MFKKFICFCVAVFAHVQQVSASQTDDNLKVTLLTAAPGDTGYFKADRPFSLSCLHQVMYFDVASESGKSYLSLQLAAKMAENTIRITYEQRANNECHVTYITML